MAGVRVDRLDPFGAIVTGLVIEECGRQGEGEWLRRALASFQLLLFRGQELSPRQQLELTACFGALETSLARRPADHQVPGFPDVLHLRNTPGSPTSGYGFGWHSDGLAYARRPSGATVLHCIDCPPSEGATLFANQYRAYDDVSTEIRQVVDTCAWYLPPVPHSEIPAGSALIQPLSRRHPVTGRRFIYCAPQARSLQGITKREGTTILATIRRSQYRNEFVYRHEWLPGDTVVWENCTLLHKRADAVEFDRQGPRLMHRSATVGYFEAEACRP